MKKQVIWVSGQKNILGWAKSKCKGPIYQTGCVCVPCSQGTFTPLPPMKNLSSDSLCPPLPIPSRIPPRSPDFQETKAKKEFVCEQFLFWQYNLHKQGNVKDLANFLGWEKYNKSKINFSKNQTTTGTAHPTPTPSWDLQADLGVRKRSKGRRSKNSLIFRTLWFRRIHKFPDKN